MSAKKKGKFSKGGPVSSSRRKLQIAIIVFGVLLLAAVACLLFLLNRDGILLPEAETTIPTDNTESIADTTHEAPSESTALPTVPAFPTLHLEITESSETTEPEETTKPVETKKPGNQGGNKKPNNPTRPTQPPATKPPATQPPATQPPATQPPATQPPATQPPATQPPATQPPATEPPKVVIHLPYTIPGTTLTIQRVAGYDGIYLEDGTDSSVSGVAMMMLTNTGFQAVEYAKITMTYDDKELTFEVSALKPGGVIAVQEAGRNSCATGDLIQCAADVAVVDSLGMAQDQVKVEDNGDNTLTVTNLTDEEIVTVRVFYKYFMAEANAYVGGITFTAKISNLEPNASVVINPSHYASGACEVVMVRTYDTDA